MRGLRERCRSVLEAFVKHRNYERAYADLVDVATNPPTSSPSPPSSPGATAAGESRPPSPSKRVSPSKLELSGDWFAAPRLVARPLLSFDKATSNKFKAHVRLSCCFLFLSFVVCLFVIVAYANLFALHVEQRFMRQMMRYLAMLDPSSGVTVGACDRYSGEGYVGGRVVLTAPTLRGERIGGLIGCIAELTRSQNGSEILLESGVNDFSVMYSVYTT